MADRYQACEIAKVNPRMIDYKGSDPVAFVRSANWHRRHLSASQRAFAQVQLSECATEGKRADTASNEAVKTKAEMATEAKVSEWVLPSRHSGAASNEAAKTKAEMAKEAGVGTTTFKHATPRFLNWFHPATLSLCFAQTIP